MENFKRYKCLRLNTSQILKLIIWVYEAFTVKEKKREKFSLVRLTVCTVPKAVGKKSILDHSDRGPQTTRQRKTEVTMMMETYSLITF